MNHDGVHILLVEDNPHDVELTLSALRQCGADDHVLVLRNGAEALNFIFGPTHAPVDPMTAPRVIVLDLKLPLVDGFEVVKRLRTDIRTRAIPVVIFSSSNDERDIGKSYRLGVNGYVVKPTDVELFSKRIIDLWRYWIGCNQPPPAAGTIPSEHAP